MLPSVDGKLNMSYECSLAAKRANCALGFIKHSIASQLREVVVPLYTELVWTHLEYCVQQLVPQSERDMELLLCPEEGGQDGEWPDLVCSA